jgi:putative transport protein
MFDSFTNAISRLFANDSVGEGMAILALAVTIGLLIGAIRIRGVRLGVSGVLFSALLFGQIGLTIEPKVLGFLRDFALVLFMYAIGLQVGPGFLSSLRAEGLRLNVLAIAVLILGAMMAAIPGVSSRAAAGVFSGAFTTTPGVAAAQEAIRRTGAPNANATVAHLGLAYTITYPFGVVGPLFLIPMLRRFFGVKLADEKLALIAADEKRRPPIEQLDIEITEPLHTGVTLKNLHKIREHGIILSRLLRNNCVSVPTADTIVQLGDIYRAVGPRERLTELATAVGRITTVNFDGVPGDVRRTDLIVTRSHVLRRPLHELNLSRRTGVTISRVHRAGVDLVPTASLRLAFADRVSVIGPEAGVKMVEAELGNCSETVNRSQLVPIFLGIVLGVIVGSIPLKFPGTHTALRIGLAGGPLLAAIALSQIGNIGPIVWYMPTAANQLFRDFGLTVFLACVGFQAGDHFFQNADSMAAINILISGAAITMIPVAIIAVFARRVLRMNFITLSGWIAGAMTSSTALMFADEMAESDAPTIAYAAVAPIATLVPIICAQVLAIKAL